jgi:hypothetical protein
MVDTLPFAFSKVFIAVAIRAAPRRLIAAIARRMANAGAGTSILESQFFWPSRRASDEHARQISVWSTVVPSSVCYVSRWLFSGSVDGTDDQALLTAHCRPTIAP